MGIDPDVAKLWKEFREDPAEPVTFISFHQTNGGSSDDEFVSQESKDRYNFYSVQGTPDAQFDGGYIEELGVVMELTTHTKTTTLRVVKGMSNQPN